MVLLEAPRARAGGSVQVKQTETYEEFVAAAHVAMEAFDYPEAMRDRRDRPTAEALGGVHDGLEPRAAVHRVDRRTRRGYGVRGPRRLPA